MLLFIGPKFINSALGEKKESTETSRCQPLVRNEGRWKHLSATFRFAMATVPSPLSVSIVVSRHHAARAPAAGSDSAPPRSLASPHAATPEIRETL
jgi:hypothetical protein